MNLVRCLLKCAGPLVVLLLQLGQACATSVPNITLSEVFDEATEVVLVEPAIKQQLVAKSATNQHLFAVSRIWKSKTGIRPGDKVEICNTRPNTEEFFEFAPRQKVKYIFFLRKKGDCLNLFFGVVSFVALEGPADRFVRTHNLVNEPASQARKLFFEKLSQLAAAKKN